MAIKDLVLKLVIDGKESLVTLDKLDNKTLGLQKSVKNIAGAMGLAFGSAQVIGFMKDSIALVQRENEVIGKLNATLNSTQFAAGMTSKELVEMANHLEEINRFKFDDKDIIDAEGLLLTFTKINKEIFPETMQLALDMSVRFDQELNPTIIQIGKALQDPIRGVTALRKVGVTFTEQQEDQIRAFVKLNDLMGAQKVVLAELTKQVGGSAAAAVDEYTLRVNKLGEAWESVMLTTGKALTYFLTDVYDFWDIMISSIGDKLTQLRNILGLPSDAGWADLLGLGEDNRFAPTDWSKRDANGFAIGKVKPGGGESKTASTISDIKNQIKDLNDSLDDTVYGSKKYLETTAEILKLENSIGLHKEKQSSLSKEILNNQIDLEDELWKARGEVLGDENYPMLPDYNPLFGKPMNRVNVPAFDPLNYTAEPVFDKIIRESDLFANTLTISFDRVWDKMIQGGLTVGDILSTVFDSLLQQIGRILSNELFDSLTTKNGGGGSSGGSFWDDLWSGVTTVLPFLGKGGIAMNPTAAVVGDVPEAIIPLDRFSGGFGTGTIERKLDQVITAFENKQFDIDLYKLRTINKRIDNIEQSLLIK